MKIRAVALLAVVAVPVTVTAARAPSVGGPAPLAIANGITANVNTTVLVRHRTKTARCALGVLPDRACSPGALDRRRGQAVVCSASFHTNDVRDVPASLKRQVEIEYGLEPKSFGSALEIDHIISLELGGSNDIANLYPELAPGFHEKDKLENRLHKLVCAGSMTLHTAQRRIAANWPALYSKVFGTAAVTHGSMRKKP